MTAPDTLRPQLVAKLRAHPILQAIREKSEFDCTVTVETGASVDAYQASVWAAAYEGSDHANFLGRFRWNRAYPDAPDVLWEFEVEDDAVLFLGRFGGEGRGRVDVSEWRQSVPYRTTSPRGHRT